MAHFIQSKTGKWRAQVERRGKRFSKSFDTRAAAESWAKKTEDKILAMAEKSEGLMSLVPKRVLQAIEAAPFSKHEILETATEWPRKSGIYFLIRDDEIKYVGQSIDILRRLASHMENSFNYEAFNIVFAPPEKLDALEDLYLAALMPPWNIGFGRNPERPERRWSKPNIRARRAEKAPSQEEQAQADCP